MHESALMLSITDSGSWLLKSACRGMNTELFYLADFARGAPKRNQEAQAKAVCATCPVIGQCLAQALEMNEPHGVWGGMTREERETLRSSEHVSVA
jgi:WhiB family transcriptional regulator, redox-sensing transcriptional regulator